MMTEVLKGKTEAEAAHLFANFHRMCTEDDYVPSTESEAEEDDLDRLSVLSGVREFPIRVKCATLAWHTMTAAMAGQDEATTE